MFTKFAVLTLGIVLLSSIAGPITVYSESVSFNPEVNLSNNANKSVTPEISTLGDDVYVVWRDGDDIFFIKSGDGGENFSSSQDIGDTGTSSTFGKPQLATSGNNVYIIWNDNNKIKFIESSDNGITFTNAEIQLSSETFVKNPQIDTPGGSSVYSSWVDKISGDDEIIFKRSTNAGSSFDGSLKLGETDVTGVAPDISSAGSSVYVAWQDSTDILFSQSSDFGASFNPSISLGSSSGNNLSVPQIATSSSGSDVYVVWQRDSDIVISHSSDSGATFSPALDIGDTGVSSDQARPQVQSNGLGTEVYVAWQDSTVGNGDIHFSKSTNSGGSFSSPSNPSNGNISANDGPSYGPKLEVSGTNVHVLWEDLTPSATGAILYRLSTDGGDTFGGFSIVSENFPQSTTASVSTIGSTPFVVWQDNDSENILFRTGEVSAVDISFDKTQYKISDTASITIVDSGSSGSITADAKSDTDTSGVQIVLTEGPTGIFTGTLGFIEGEPSSGDTLQVSHSDTVTVSFNDSDGTATIFSRTIEFEGPLPPPKFDLGEIVHLKVTDNNANSDPNQIDTVFVSITSNTDPQGTSLILEETGIDTGIFGGDGLSDLVFSLNVNTLALTESMTISQFFILDDKDPTSPDTITVKITTTSDPIGITLNLVETGNDTDVFEGTITPVILPIWDNQIKAQGGDILTVTIGSLKSHTLVTPNPNPSNGIIPVSVTATDGDTVVATYKQVSATAELLDAHAPGGGGGGLVRPSLVVNALVGVGGSGTAPVLQLNNLVKLGQIDVPLEVEQMILNHDSSIPTPPMLVGFFENFDYPLIINDKGFVLSGYSTTLETATLQTNTPQTIKFLYYESDKIQHFSLYTNLRDANTAIPQSDTQILYNDGQEIKVVDPNGFFEDVSLTINEIDDLKKEIVLEIIFAKEMATSDIIVRSWDPFFNSFDTYILDAIEVVSGIIEESPTPTYEEPVIEELQSQSIPKWIKNNAGWWSDQQISDSDFVSGIEYLIKNEIINVPGVEAGTSSATAEIPEWIKNNAGWWAESLITDGDFIEGIQWLVANGVIQI